MDKERVEKLVRSRIEKHKINPTAVDDELDSNAFNPIRFLIDELKKVQEEKKNGAKDIAAGVEN